jgi:hypothetical protein
VLLTERLASVMAPTSRWTVVRGPVAAPRDAGQRADPLPEAWYLTLGGQEQDVAPEALVPGLVGFFAGLNGARPRTSSHNDRLIARVILNSWMTRGASFINLQTQEVADADHRREAIRSPRASRGTPCQLSGFHPRHSG